MAVETVEETVTVSGQSPTVDVQGVIQQQVSTAEVIDTMTIALPFVRSATFQSLPGPEITASYVATSAQIRPSLGRNLASGANGTATIPLVEPGTMYAERLYQVDARLTKIFNIGRTRLRANLDLYNALIRALFSC